MADDVNATQTWFSLEEPLLHPMIFETFGDQRYTQDSPIMPDVWIAFLHAPRRTVDVLLTPRSGDSPSRLAKRLAERLAIYAGLKPSADESWTDPVWAAHCIAYSRSSVVASVTFNELIHVVVPMTTWWSGLGDVERSSYFAMLRDKIEGLAAQNMNLSDIIVDASRVIRRSAWDFIRFCALAGLIALMIEYEARLDEAAKPQDAPPPKRRTRGKRPAADDTPREDPAVLKARLQEQIHEFIRGLSDGQTQIAKITALIDAYERLAGNMVPEEAKPPLQVFMVTQNRDAHLSIDRSRATIKADAANNVFQIDTSDFAWAVIDCGIDARHPAFLDYTALDKLSPPERDAMPKLDIPAARLDTLSRVRETYDFTYLRQLLATKDLPPPDKGGPSQQIAAFIRKNHERELSDLRIRTGLGREIDWQIVAPLIRVPHDDNYEPPQIGHGTHVAGIIGADWEADDNPEGVDLLGMCPQINLYDLRVFKPESGSDEFTVQYALQFVRHLNQSRELPRIHGANLSLSMLHKVMSFGCGRTPVCDECNALVGTGVVVVVAAGNDGYKTFKTDKGDYSGYHTASITDPGNAQDVITVGATHRSHPHTYGVSYFSSRGPTGDGRRKPDLVAPGEKITAPVVNCGVQRMDGTSMAAPHVSGAAVLLMARHRELIGEPRRIKDILCATATDLGREPHFQGAGLVDVLRALQSV